ncbi:MAG TPA: sensor histidine kinase [Vicinamibacterales bacterium]|nr:sensor histidine kinase [Vicinamibacterales bacterium]
MRFRTWPVVAIGVGSLVLLIVVSMLAASRKVQSIYVQLDQRNTHHRDVDLKLRRLRSDVNLSGIFVRDYLLDVAREQAPESRRQLAEFRRANIATLVELEPLLERNDQFQRLQLRLDEYWQALDPLFEWSPAEISRSASFLRKEVVPRREAALTIAREIEEINNAYLAEEREEVARQHATLLGDLRRLLWQTVLLGLAVAAVVVVRLGVLERRSANERMIAEDAERQMRQLSQQLVAAQEEERKHLSRELHDHVAQVLTGLRMELGRIERMPAPADGRLGPAVAECKQLIDDLFSTVRNLSLGLRPSMLDDLGLQAALEWHVRDFLKRYDIGVELTMRGNLDRLPERHRTCVYRVVQEALTNCVRHARARSIHIAVTAADAQLQVGVIDDGVGFDPTARRNGLGLRGIEERVRELDGTMSIGPDARGGTRLAITLPMSPRIQEVPRARAAG